MSRATFYTLRNTRNGRHMGADGSETQNIDDMLTFTSLTSAQEWLRTYGRKDWAVCEVTLQAVATESPSVPNAVDDLAGRVAKYLKFASDTARGDDQADVATVLENYRRLLTGQQSERPSEMVMYSMGSNRMLFERLAKEDPARLLEMFRTLESSYLAFAVEIAGRRLSGEAVVPVLLGLADHPSALVREGVVMGLSHHMSFPGVVEKLRTMSEVDAALLPEERS